MSDIELRADSLLRDVIDEHRELQSRLSKLRALVGAPQSAPEIAGGLIELAKQLRQMRERMEIHFAEEAAGGFLEEAVTRLPRLAESAANIEAEHPELLRRVDSALTLAEKADPSTEGWQHVRGAVEEFVRQMLAHEAKENRLLQQGFNEDFGLGE